jgi:hypothetical protein
MDLALGIIPPENPDFLYLESLLLGNANGLGIKTETIDPAIAENFECSLACEVFGITWGVPKPFNPQNPHDLVEGFSHEGTIEWLIFQNLKIIDGP